MKKYKLFSFILVLVAIITLSMTVSVNASDRVSAIDLTTYFGRILDSAPTQLINEAQIWYGERELADTEYADLPVLSAAAPFKAGRLGRNDFAYVEAGELSWDDLNEIYIYHDNEVRGVKLNGAQIIDWLEHVGNHFELIDPELEDEQHIVNYDQNAYNHDIIEGIEYQYDLTKPVGERVVYATYMGDELSEDHEFIVITNNHRAAGGFPHMDGESTVYSSDDRNLDILIEYVEAHSPVEPTPSNNWSLKSFETAGPLVYQSHPDAVDFIEKYEIQGLELIETTLRGWGVFEVDLFELSN